MSLVGSLEDLGLGDILQIVSLSRKSGLLLLRSDEGDGRIFFREGLVQAAYVKGEPEDLRSLLLAGGFADPGGLDSAVESARVQGRSAEDAAAACSGLSEQRLEALLREHVERAVLRMFRWRVGEFSFEVRDDMDVGDLPLALPHGINAQYLTMEATRLGDEGAGPAADSEDAFVLSGEGASGEARRVDPAGQEVHEELAVAAAARVAEEPEAEPLPEPEPEAAAPEEEAELPALRVAPPRLSAQRVPVAPPPAAEPPPTAEPPVAEPPPTASPPAGEPPPAAPPRRAAQGPGIAPPPPPLAPGPLALGPPEEEQQPAGFAAEPEVAAPERTEAAQSVAQRTEPAQPVAEPAEPARAVVPAAPAPHPAGDAAPAQSPKLPLVVIDPDLPALEWVKSQLAGIFTRVHIFQHSEGGIARIRQYLSRAELPVVLVSVRAPADSLTGAADVAELLGRLRAQAPRLPIVAMCETDAEIPPGVDAADALVTRPPAGVLRDPKRRELLEEAGEQLHAALRPWALPVAGTLPAPPPRSRRRAQAIDASLRSLKEMSERLRDRATKGEVLNLVLDFAAVRFRRVAMFMVREEDVVGIAQRGLVRAGGPDDERFLALRVPLEDSAWLRTVIETRESLRAGPGNDGDRRLAALLGSRLPIEAFVAPIESGGRVAALLYADNLPEATPIGDTTVLAIVLHEAGLALDRAVLERALAQADHAS